MRQKHASVYFKYTIIQICLIKKKKNLGSLTRVLEHGFSQSNLRRGPYHKTIKYGKYN